MGDKCGRFLAHLSEPIKGKNQNSKQKENKKTFQDTPRVNTRNMGNVLRSGFGQVKIRHITVCAPVNEEKEPSKAADQEPTL